jgi:hypothetical protein
LLPHIEAGEREIGIGRARRFPVAAFERPKREQAALDPLGDDAKGGAGGLGQSGQRGKFARGA